MGDITCATSNQLILTIPETSATVWHGLLRRGVGVFLEQAVSVRDFMTEILGMDVDYATNSVPGLFLNNAPVDEWREELVGDGDELGMSGTMPGLCGIALRRSSPIRAFRPDLVSRHDEEKRTGGVAVVKMFNFVALDCFKPVLMRGVVVSPQAVLQYVDDQEIDLQQCDCEWNEAPVSLAEVREILAGACEDITLVVRMNAG
ncbi:hypothetical protein [Desulfomicrobium baculatum]|uniref:Uncharacterized protein n=1 Tax=Desulfomicrobium baculatum (strain DSM 4028 / VKM B-1378 / X) TaxID=525897 RepID=C7LV40_DESBD|nr:hypothetical protein [Desulfomicrobium baculatum]ACU91044.1 hypothetical protein Dbac_2969 [Desulfomicrobium baculatum DSM 4028]